MIKENEMGGSILIKTLKLAKETGRDTEEIIRGSRRQEQVVGRGGVGRLDRLNGGQV